MTALPEPVSRQDKLLHNIADETPSIEDLVPNCREEVYLKYIAINGAAKKEIPLKIEHGGTEAIIPSKHERIWEFIRNQRSTRWYQNYLKIITIKLKQIIC